MKRPGSDVKLHIENWCKKPGHDIVISENGMMCYRIDGDTIWTGAAWVHPDHRREGVMTKIVLRILQKHSDKKFIMSMTNPKLTGVTQMYLKMGRKKPKETQDGLLWKDLVEEIIRRNKK